MRLWGIPLVRGGGWHPPSACAAREMLLYCPPFSSPTQPSSSQTLVLCGGQPRCVAQPQPKCRHLAGSMVHLGAGPEQRGATCNRQASGREGKWQCRL